ncbi:hypothetical protein C3K47_11285 [Solitalea longa]|uniref:Uncharacterized protein n=1 Tax=Solitalea longa TaxID=2079460 RepID=A0A2S5A188_9SPHI|nr:hypothetical protein [Solitalea longa]POY36325.1 hypothetical protein C3K47_11285 [Solitalea longa]
MKKHLLQIVFILLFISGSAYAQKYMPPPNNDTFKETVKGVTYVYAEGYVTVTNNSGHDLAVLTIQSEYNGEKSVNGIVFFEDIPAGGTQKQKVEFTLDSDESKVDYKTLKPELLVFSYLKAVRD